MGTEAVILLLFVVASVVAMLARRLSIPYTVALVIAGLILGSLQLVHAPELTRDVLFLIFLPGLIFEAAFHINFDDLWRDRATVLGLAIPGVILTIAVTALLLVSASKGIQLLPGISLPEMGWPLALLFGAAIAATDPIAVTALFERLGAPQRLNLLIKGESLLDDGTAIVFFNLVMVLLAGERTSGSELLVEFIRVVGGGVVVGSIIGLMVAQALQRIDDAMVAITLTTVAAYGSFLVADQSGFSGVMSTVAAGLICGNYGMRRGVSPSLKVAANTFWEYLGFALNSLVFLLMAFEIRLDALWATWLIILLAYLAMTLARALVVAITCGALAWTPARIPRSWALILSWGGLRGALSMVLVLSLPPSLPMRETVINMVFGVVLLSIFVQGTSMAPLARRLGLLGRRETMMAYEVARARLQAAADVLVEIGHLRDRGTVDAPVLDAMETSYRQRMSEANTQLQAIDLDPELRFREDFTQLHRRMLQFEKSRALEIWQQGMIGDKAYQQLLSDIDARFLELESSGDNITLKEH